MKKLTTGNLYSRYDLSKLLETDCASINSWIAIGALPAPIVTRGQRVFYTEAQVQEIIEKQKGNK